MSSPMALVWSGRAVAGPAQAEGSCGGCTGCGGFRLGREAPALAGCHSTTGRSNRLLVFALDFMLHKEMAAFLINVFSEYGCVFAVSL